MPRLLKAIGALVILMAGVTASAQAPAGVRSQLVWFDRAGHRLGTVAGLADYGNLELSPDGTQVAVAVLDAERGTHDLWVYDTAGPGRRRFTDSPADENWLVWSPDGGQVVFNSFGPDGLELHQAIVDGTDRRIVLADEEGKWPVSWSSDGEQVLVVKNHPQTGNDIWVLTLTDGTLRPFLRTPLSENWAAFSPNGRWVAFSSSESGQAEVYVTSFPDGGRRWLVSRRGGIQARWRRDGRELFYLALDGTIESAMVDGQGTEFLVEEPRPLFTMNVSHPPYHAFDVSPDGQQILVNWLFVSPGGSGVVADAGRGRSRQPRALRVPARVGRAAEHAQLLTVGKLRAHEHAPVLPAS